MVVLGGEGEISKLAPTLPINTSSNRLPPSDSHRSQPASQGGRKGGRVGGRGKRRGDEQLLFIYFILFIYPPLLCTLLSLYKSDLSSIVFGAFFFFF